MKPFFDIAVRYLIGIRKAIIHENECHSILLFSDFTLLFQTNLLTAYLEFWGIHGVQKKRIPFHY